MCLIHLPHMLSLFVMSLMQTVDTKWSCFCDFQTLIFNKGDRKSSKNYCASTLLSIPQCNWYRLWTQSVSTHSHVFVTFKHLFFDKQEEKLNETLLCVNFLFCFYETLLCVSFLFHFCEKQLCVLILFHFYEKLLCAQFWFHFCRWGPWRSFGLVPL